MSSFPPGSYGGGTFGVPPVVIPPPPPPPNPALVPAARVVPEPSEFGRVYDTLRALIDSYVSYFESRDVLLPTDDDGRIIAFVSDGTIPYDEPLFAVEFMRYRMGPPGTPSSSPIMGNSEYSIEASVHLVRRVPVINISGVPTPDEREGAARELLLDTAILSEGAIDLTRKAMEGGPEYLVGAPYRRVQILEIVPYGPAGGIGGNVATLIVDPR